ncbi:MAG: peptidoglycan DD-metalloendopeptidase family protein [Caulobacteraceae bacterium]
MRRVLAIALILLTGVLQAPAQGAAPAADLRQIDSRERALAGKIGVNRNRLARVLGALQRLSRDPPPAFLVRSSDARDAVRAAILIRAITPKLEAEARQLQAEATRLAAQRRRAATADADRFEAESRAVDLQRVDGLLAAVPPPPGADLGPAPTSLTWPVTGPVRTAFGGRLASGAPSRGMEFEAQPGAAVVAPGVAQVEYAGPLAGWGLVLILRGAGGYHYVLTGLGEVKVQPGQSVAPGTTIGAMPKGVEGPPRLYLEVRLEDGPVDPAPFLASISH